MSLERTKQEIIQVKPYSLKELSGMYGVSKNTFKKWLIPFKQDLGERNGYYYSNYQVNLMFERLGAPGQKFAGQQRINR
ncbi:MAG: hypothetical protein H0V65_01800 [Chitinophagales bacterium]|jgi:transposase-like protein|nr:hypothetical protein [Chitinophagales bacterium]